MIPDESRDCRFDPGQDHFFFYFWSSPSLLFCTFLGCYKLDLEKLLVGIVTLCSYAVPTRNATIVGTYFSHLGQGPKIPRVVGRLVGRTELGKSIRAGKHG